MAFSKQRNRVVVFRLTQDEYEDLKGACLERGQRTLSEFARSELLSAIRSDSIRNIIQTRFAEFERKLAELQMSIVQSTGGPSPMPQASTWQGAAEQD
jgi:hypothetical protein